jgi:hypothetical protein
VVVSPEILVGAAVAVAAGATLVVAAHPRGAWRGAAEHARAFWLGWALLAAGLGAAGLLRAGVGWASVAWLAVWVAVGVLAPSMVTDVLDARRLRRRRPVLADRGAALGVVLPPIRWHAPEVLPAGPVGFPARRLSA